MKPTSYFVPAAAKSIGSGIVIGDRYFIKNYLYTVFEYARGNTSNELIVPDNLVG